MRTSLQKQRGSSTHVSALKFSAGLMARFSYNARDPHRCLQARFADGMAEASGARPAQPCFAPPAGVELTSLSGAAFPRGTAAVSSSPPTCISITDIALVAVRRLARAVCRRGDERPGAQRLGRRRGRRRQRGRMRSCIAATRAGHGSGHSHRTSRCPTRPRRGFPRRSSLRGWSASH
jgi:hypothetical protein